MVFSVFPFFLFIYIIAEKWKSGKIPYLLILKRVMLSAVVSVASLRITGSGR